MSRMYLGRFRYEKTWAARSDIAESSTLSLSLSLSVPSSDAMVDILMNYFIMH